MVTKTKVLKPREKRLATKIIEGETIQDAGVEEYPNATPQSARVLASRQINKPHVQAYIQDGKLKAIEDSGITWQKILQPVVDALQAVKENQNTGEVTPDHNVRMAASRRAQELLESYTRVKEIAQLDELENPTITLEEGDELELSHALFRKGKNIS